MTRNWTFIAELELEDQDVEPMRLDLVAFLQTRCGRRPRTKTIHTAQLDLALHPPQPPRLIHRVEAPRQGKIA